MPEVRDTIIDDVFQLAPILREEDREEVKALSGNEPLESLIAGYLMCAYCKSIISDEGVCIGMFGVGHVEEGVGRVWFLMAEELIEKHRIRFARESRMWLKDVHKAYPLLYNFVYKHNEVHVRWLKWLGFSFIKYFPEFGAGREPFYHFVKLENNYV